MFNLKANCTIFLRLKKSIFDTFLDVTNNVMWIIYIFSKWKMSAKCLCVANVIVCDVLWKEKSKIT